MANKGYNFFGFNDREPYFKNGFGLDIYDMFRIMSYIEENKKRRYQEEKISLDTLYSSCFTEEQNDMFGKQKKSKIQEENNVYYNERAEGNMSDGFGPNDKKTDEAVNEPQNTAGEPEIPDFLDKKSADYESRNEIRNLQDEILQLRKELEKKEAERQEALRESQQTKLEYQKKTEELVEEKIKVKNEWRAKYKAEYEAAMSEAKEQIAEYKSELMESADLESEDMYKNLLKGKVGEYVSGVRDEWRHAHKDMAETNEDIAKSISFAKVDACNESSRIQREMRETIDKYKEYLDGSMLQFFAGLDRWRESVFDTQFKDFAEWYSRFCGFVDRFDSRLVNGVEGCESGSIAKIGSSLNSLKNALERTLPSMGLKSYYPLPGDKYDPVYHEAVEEEYVPDGTVIKSCVTPGVELISSNDELRRVLVKSEVDVEVN